MTDPYTWLIDQLALLATSEQKAVDTLWLLETYIDDLVEAIQDGDAPSMHDAIAHIAKLLCSVQERVDSQ